MAKELPYFKFEPSEWDNGNIQMCSFNTRAMFIELCCIYWIRVGDLPYALALQKVCGGNQAPLIELKKHQIIKVDDDFISIRFLDEQLESFTETSAKNSASARKRWGGDASAMRAHSERNAIREDKKKEDETIIPSVDEFVKFCISKKADVDPNSAKLKFDQWLENGWINGFDKPIKNWRTSAIGVLEHLKTIKPKGKYKLDRSKSKDF
jgi:hypothetical protein|tara:strand:- start:311 stop:937 length:627 start_codon:yes stop_codon:yes gene_type:complete